MGSIDQRGEDLQSKTFGANLLNSKSISLISSSVCKEKLRELNLFILKNKGTRGNLIVVFKYVVFESIKQTEPNPSQRLTVIGQEAAGIRCNKDNSEQLLRIFFFSPPPPARVVLH